MATTTPLNYTFPTHRLKKTMDDPSKTPIVLVNCGSFSPITILHLRLFEMALDYTKFDNSEFEVVGGYFSPVSDAYKKKGLVEAEHRIAMCQRAVDQDSTWLMLDPYEALQSEYTPTTDLLDHFHTSLNSSGGILTSPSSNTRKPITVVLLAGADLIQTMSDPSVWTRAELQHILGGPYLTFVVERAGTDVEGALEFLKEWKAAIHLVRQAIVNEVSSTKVRKALGEGRSVRYLVPRGVEEYIEERGLYRG